MMSRSAMAICRLICLIQAQQTVIATPVPVK